MADVECGGGMCDVKENTGKCTSRYAMVRLGVGAAVVLFFVVTCFQKTLWQLFQWHPILMALGYTVLMVEGISAGKMISRSRAVEERKAWKSTHMWLLTASTLCILGGFTAIFVNKVNNKREHFLSWHGTLGAVTVFVTLTQAVLGYALFYSVPAKLGMSLGAMAQMRTLHYILAFLAAAMGVASMCFGLTSNFAVGMYSPATRLTVGGLIAVLHAYALLG